MNGMGSLDGLVTGFGLWVLAGLFVLAAVAFCIASLRTGKRALYGPRLVASLVLSGGLVLGSFQLRRVPDHILEKLDETILLWIVPAFALGLFACFKFGRR